MAFEEKVNPVQAAEEMEGWLDFKRVAPKKRETYKDGIETLTEAIQYGIIVIEDDKTIVHTLAFPIGESKSITQLKYKPRVEVEEIRARMKNVKTGDGDGRIIATVAALTNTATGILNKMDTEDKSIADAVAVFFL